MSALRYVRSLLLVAGACGVASTSTSAQGALQVIPRPEGRAAYEVAVKAADASALDVLTAATSSWGVALKTDAASLRRLAATTVRIERDFAPLQEIALLIGQLAGVEARFEGDALRATAVPEDAAAGRESRRRTAQRHLDFALGSRPDAARTPELAASRGRLAYIGGEFATAAAAFRTADGAETTGATAQEHRIRAAEAALRAGRTADASAAVEAYERSQDPPSPLPGAELVPARVHLAAGDVEGAKVRLRRVRQEGRFPRDRALASFLLAEEAHARRDGKAMIDALDRIAPETLRAYPDLERRMPLGLGLALSLLGERDSALLHLRLAVREDLDVGRRAHAARAVAEELRAAQRPFEALLAARQAVALAPPGILASRAAVLQSALETSLGLADRAFATATAALAADPGTGPETDQLLNAAAVAAVGAGRLDVARATLAALTRREGVGPRIVRLEAEIERRSGRPLEALTLLERLSAAEAVQAGFDAASFASLKGELALAAGRPLRAAEAFAGPAEDASK